MLISTSPAAWAGSAASDPDPEQLGRAPQQRDVADRLGRGQQDQAPRLRGERLEPARKALLEAAAQRRRTRQPEAAGDRHRLQPARELEQRERIAAGLVEDPILDARVQRPRDRRLQQLPGVVGGQALDHELRQPVEARTPRRSRAARTRVPHARPGAGARRTRASAPTPGPATARRRRCTPAAAPPPCRPEGSAPPARRGSDPGAGPRSGRTPCSAHPAAGPADAPDGRASARTARAARRTRAPSRTARPPPGRSGTLSRPTTDTPAARSCRRPPRHAAPAPRSARRPRPVPADPVPRAHSDDPASPAMGRG